MDRSLLVRLEDATGIAFEQYRKRHPRLALEIEESALFNAVVMSIRSDPEARNALREAVVEQSRIAAINRILDLVTSKLPAALKLIGM